MFVYNFVKKKIVNLRNFKNFLAYLKRTSCESCVKILFIYLLKSRACLYICLFNACRVKPILTTYALEHGVCFWVINSITYTIFSGKEEKICVFVCRVEVINVMYCWYFKKENGSYATCPYIHTLRNYGYIYSRNFPFFCRHHNGNHTDKLIHVFRNRI